jgi:molybdate transport system ATP-binding protein
MLDARIIKARSAFTVDVRINAAPGDSLALFGASGAGKSTVLSCIAGLENPDDGEIRFGDDILFPPPRPLNQRGIGYLTQEDLLFPHMTVAGNVCFGLDALNGARNENWVATLKDRLAIGTIWNQSARGISGGQARRVALARMLARQPRLVLLDEPFAGLDRPTMSELVNDLIEWHRELRFTMIAVDHRAEILERLCRSVAVIENGRIVQRGSWQEIAAAPSTPLLARLLPS